ncbi:DUF5367 family protein [Croceitalea rosinachiae]|uniref:DUF5367 family protein n=1 Tax=Croceitalea rosinachiae TaxID=3075596 RepID=A0ABU3AA78_9FLAO|nr:DUF5367 family protein [Croceitalea sp. F388]MDT0606869.1 DUF5367 family protein [Croceitalea sp. F388]
MKTLRAIVIGILIWILGVSAFTLSFFIPVLENLEQQANLVLLIAAIPLVWFGSQQYYKKDTKTHGMWVGITFFGVAAILDALITVPFLVAPQGGSHYVFFTDSGFWLIGGVFITTAILYGHFRGTRDTQRTV